MPMSWDSSLSPYLTTAVLIASIASAVLVTMGLFSRKNGLPVEGRTVLLTGASQGMGLSVARMLSSKGASLIIVARDEKRLANALVEVSDVAKNPSTQRFHTISADVTSQEENSRIMREATEWNGGYPPDIVWAIAGMSKPSLMLETSPEIMKSQMDINYWAAHYICRECLQAWLPPSSIAPGAPHLPRQMIVTSSVLAFISIVGYTQYAPAKAALRCFADTMRSELNIYNGWRRMPNPDPARPPPPTDINMRIVVPGTIDSPGLLQENDCKHDVSLELEKHDPIQSSDAVAAAAIRELEKGKYLVNVNWFGRLMGGASWNGSPRGNWLVDTCMACFASWALLLIVPALESDVWNYGKKWGVERKSKLKAQV